MDLQAFLTPALADSLHRQTARHNARTGLAGINHRHEFSKVITSEPWELQRLGDVMPGLVAGGSGDINAAALASIADTPLRAAIYGALGTFIVEKLGTATWEQLAEKSTYDLKQEFRKRSLKVLMEMLFDRSLIGVTDTVVAAPADTQEVVEELPGAPVAGLVESILSGFAGRELQILQQRYFMPVTPTLASIAGEFEITRERVRQIAEKALKKVKKAVRYDKLYAPVPAAAREFADRVGPIFPGSHELVDSIWDSILGSEAESVVKNFLIWLAGPYQYKDGWWFQPDCWRADTIDAELSAEIEKGNCDHAAIAGVFEQHGVNEHFIGQLIEAHPRLNRVFDTYIWGRPTWAARAAAALRHNAEPMTLEDIGMSLEAGDDLRSLSNALAMSDDILKIDTRRYGLPEWGFSEYTGVSDAIAEAITDNGGRIDLRELAATVASTTGARESSVRHYCQAPRFVMEGDMIRLRRKNEPFQPDTSRLPTRPGIFTYPDRTSVRLTVGPEDFRGSGRAIADDIAFHLGARINERVVYAGDGFELALTRPETSPENGSLSSLRETVLKYEAADGDELRIDFYPAEKQVRVFRVSPAAVQELEAAERLRLLTGARGLTAEELENELDIALGTPLAGVETALKIRGDTDVLEALQQFAGT